ncbi:MAG: carbohydrate ABC transporter permease [Beutenbergiaceae bacterium]
MATATAQMSTQRASRPAGSAIRSGTVSDRLAGWVFVAPFLVFFIAFLVWPMLHGLYLSFTDLSLTGAGGNFVGFANYVEAFADADMWRSLGNTAYFTVLTTVPLVVLALVMAVLVEQGLPGQWLWRLSFFMPYLLASTVVSHIWVWLFNPQLGAVNGLLAIIGAEPLSVLQDPNTAMIGVVIATIWWTIGFNFLLYLAAIQNIPPQQYEAAQIDGAGRFRQFWSITMPQLWPTTVLIVMLQILASLKLFDQVYQMTEGGPGGTTRSILLYVYEIGFTGFRFGFSAAVSYVFFALIIILSIVQVRITARRSAA